MMVGLGLLITFLGFLISFLSLSFSSTVGGRMTMVLIGLLVSLVGIIGVLNQAYVKNAPWRK